MANVIFKLVRTLILISIVFSGLQYLINNKSYTFRAAEIKRLGEKYVGQHPSQCLTKIATDLRRTYGSHVIASADARWITVAGGGLQGKVYFLHASVTEYLAVYGFPLATSGHRGIHWFNESCSILTGNLQRSKDDANLLQREDFGPGDHVRYGMFEGSSLSSGDDTWMLCYGRGFMPASTIYWTIGSLANGDPISLAQLYMITAKSSFYQLSLWLQESFMFYKSKYLS